MSKIHIGIFDQHRLTREGLASLLGQGADLDIVLKADTEKGLMESLNRDRIHILIVNVHAFDEAFHALLKQLRTHFPLLPVLVMSAVHDEDAVLKTIRAGARGFLSRESEPGELLEAVHTLRNGFDYFSKPVIHLLLNTYISKVKAPDGPSNLKSLSNREIEIMKLWGSGLTNKEIAEKLYLSVRTVETHKNHIMQKLNLKTAVDLVKFGIRNNIIQI